MIPNLAQLATYKSSTIIAPKDRDVIISSIEEPKDELPKVPEPAWAKISIGKRRYGMYAGYPYEETLINLTSEESKAYKRILDAYDFDTGLSIINTQTMTHSEKTVFSRGFRDLHKRSLVKRVKKFTYLINPEARIHQKLFEPLLTLWCNTP